MAVGDQVRMLAALACLGALLTVAPRTVAHLLAPAAAPVAPGTLGVARGPVAAVPARGTADPSGVPHAAGPRNPSAAATPTGPQGATARLCLLAGVLLAASALLHFLRRPKPTEECLPIRDMALAPADWALAAAAGAPTPIYVINGFYMAMRDKYTTDGAAIVYMLAEWDPAALSWKDFRGKVLGATDPAAAPSGSVRRTILESWQDLGLASEPTIGDNGVHASASPFEGLVERMNWLGRPLAEDDFGRALLAAGIPEDTLLAWTKDPQVEFEGQRRGLFDVMEDTDGAECIRRAQAIAGVSGPIPAVKNQAFVFVKPHAVHPKAIELAQAKLTTAGITLGASGQLDGPTIEARRLIDNHYYAIANKASLTAPKDLQPPAPRLAEFSELFGEQWADALAAGRVFNALEACKALGINGDALDTIWAKAKKAGRLVKFGGGFYVGQLTP